MMLRGLKKHAQEIAEAKLAQLSARKKRDGRANFDRVSISERQHITWETVRELKQTRKDCKLIPAWLLFGILQGVVAWAVRRWLERHGGKR